MTWEAPTDWEEFRETYAADSPGLARVADAFQDTFEFLSYADLRVAGKQVAVLRFANFLGDRFAVFATKGKPVHLSRFTDSGTMRLVPILRPLPNETLWDAVARTVMLNSN